MALVVRRFNSRAIKKASLIDGEENLFSIFSLSVKGFLECFHVQKFKLRVCSMCVIIKFSMVE